VIQIKGTFQDTCRQIQLQILLIDTIRHNVFVQYSDHHKFKEMLEVFSLSSASDLLLFCENGPDSNTECRYGQNRKCRYTMSNKK